MKCGRRAEAPVQLGPQPDVWRDDNTCSYCGSLSPTALFDAITKGVMISPTAKNYKIYVGERKFYFQHFLNDDGKQNKELCMRFIALYNDKSMKLNYPGHFYVKPFFMKFA